MGEIEEYFDMKGGQQGSNSVDEAEDVESISSSNFILASFGRQRSDHRYDYPRAPSLLHFTHLNSPATPASSSGYFMPSPFRTDNTKPGRRRRRRRCCRLVFCCCCCTLFSLLLTAILVALVTWLLVRPIHLPRFSVENLEFETLEFESDSSGGLSATGVFTITAENRNKRLGFKYDAIGVEASYRGRVFGHSQVPAFSLGHRNVTTLSSELQVVNFSFIPSSVGHEFLNDLELERVELHVRAIAKVWLKNTPAFTAFEVVVNCDIAVKPPQGSSPSSLLSKTCKLTR